MISRYAYIYCIKRFISHLNLYSLKIATSYETDSYHYVIVLYQNSKFLYRVCFSIFLVHTHIIQAITSMQIDTDRQAVR